MEASKTSAIAGAAVTFPPGSIAVATTVTLLPGPSLAASSTASDLGLSGQLAGSGTSVTIASSVATDSVTPYTVSLALPAGAGLALADPYANLVVLYRVTKVGEGTQVSGLIPLSDLNIGSGVVQFKIRYFGTYQAVLTGKPVTASRETTASTSATNDYPFSTARPEQICSGIQYSDSTGKVITGTRACAAPECNSDLATGCLATASYPALKKANLQASNLLSGTTVSGVTGSISSCSADGATGCVTNGTFKAAAMSRVTASSILTGTTILGVAGSATAEAHSNCTSDGATNCVSTAAYPAAQTSGLAAKVLNGSTVAGVAGTATLPYANYVRTANGPYGIGGNGTTPTLADCASDGATGCVTSSSYRAADMMLATAANVASGVTIAGITGTHSPNCASDGQQNCTTTAVYKAANPSTITTWDLRAGLTFAGLTGTLRSNCRNTVTTATYNFDGAVGSLPNAGVATGTANDYWDTIDDSNGLPSGLVSGWSTNTSCDSTVFQDVTTINGGGSTTSCGTSSTCIYKDLITNLQVTGVLASGYNTTTASPTAVQWNSAVQACNGSTYGGYAAGSWRLPTAKELISLYSDGLRPLLGTSSFNVAPSTALWSATSFSASTTMGLTLTPSNGTVATASKTMTYNVVCVR